MPTQSHAKFNEWLNTHNHSPKWAADQLKVSLTTIRTWLTGKHIPSARRAIEISSLTDGEVAVANWEIIPSPADEDLESEDLESEDSEYAW